MSKCCAGNDCKRIISDNATLCKACSEKPSGVLEILNVQGGDVKITFDTGDIGQTVRAKRIITDMLRRGYALVVEVERTGERAYERVQSFDEKRGEYIIADFDSLEAAKADAAVPPPPNSDSVEEQVQDAVASVQKPRGRPRTRALSMETTKATGIGRSAGG